MRRSRASLMTPPRSARAFCTSGCATRRTRRGSPVSEAHIRWIGGPVLRARMQGPFHLHEALSVGAEGLLGEIVQLRDDELVAQVYEDTTGLRPGDGVIGTGQPLSARL